MRTTIMTVFFLAVCAAGFAQKKETYWVVEMEGKTATYSIVKIYDVANNLVTERRVDRAIDIHKKKERRRLNRMLKQQDQLLWSKR